MSGQEVEMLTSAAAEANGSSRPIQQLSSVEVEGAKRPLEAAAEQDTTPKRQKQEDGGSVKKE